MKHEGIFRCKYDILCDEEKKFFGEREIRKNGYVAFVNAAIQK